MTQAHIAEHFLMFKPSDNMAESINFSGIQLGPIQKSRCVSNNISFMYV